VADAELKELMDKVRKDARVIISWPEDWIVKVLQTGGKDIRAIRDGLDRAIRGQDLADPVEACVAAIKDMGWHDIFLALWQTHSLEDQRTLADELFDRVHDNLAPPVPA
jgi:hypothetical protein